MCPGGTKSCTEAGNSHTSSTSHGRKTLLIPSSGSNYPPPVHRIFCHYTDRLLGDRINPVAIATRANGAIRPFPAFRWHVGISAAREAQKRTYGRSIRRQVDDGGL